MSLIMLHLYGDESIVICSEKEVFIGCLYIQDSMEIRYKVKDIIIK